MKRKRKKGNNFCLDTLVGAQTFFAGSIYTECSVCVEGSVQGKIEAKGEVMVGRQGKVEADIHAETVVVGGHIIGNITARRRLEITATGRVTGDIEAASIAVAEGGIVDGFCKMIEPVESAYPQLQQEVSVKEDEHPELHSGSEAV
ncbi:MAG: polymer-forming cytoskeletal protein [Syntrophobacteria bacterium]